MQATLFPIGSNPKDVVFTPDNVAQDMVRFFQPRHRGEIVDSENHGRWRAGDAHRWADCLPARKKELCTK